MNLNKNALIGAVILFVLIGGLAWYLVSPTEPVAEQESEEATNSSYAFGEELSEAEVVDTTDEILDILDQLYYITQDTTSSVEPDTTSALIIQMITESLTDKSTINGLIPRAQRLSESKNEVVNTVGIGLLAGLTGLSKAEDDMAQFLRTVDPMYPDLAEFQYQIAAFSSAQKEVFKMISISAGQLPILFWEGAESENPTGPIPYRISKETRQHILSKINSLFADDIVADERNHELTGSTNAVIFIVKSYRDSLTPDTYEEVVSE